MTKFTEKEKRKLCELAGVDFSESATNYYGKLNFPDGDFNASEYYDKHTLEILIKAKIKINQLYRNGINDLNIQDFTTRKENPHYSVWIGNQFPKWTNFNLSDHNSETEALSAALRYVLEHM